MFTEFDNFFYFFIKIKMRITSVSEGLRNFSDGDISAYDHLLLLKDQMWFWRKGEAQYIAEETVRATEVTLPFLLEELDGNRQ